MANPYPATFIDGNAEGRLVGELNFTDPANQPDGAQPFVRVTLRHSADFANVVSGVPVISDGRTIDPPEMSLTLPPSLFGNNSIIDVRVFNRTAADVDVNATLVVQSADGTIWIDRDVGFFQTIAAGATASVDFDTDGGSAGAGLSWNAATKQVDIANAGAWSAFTTIFAVPTT